MTRPAPRPRSLSNLALLLGALALPLGGAACGGRGGLIDYFNLPTPQQGGFGGVGGYGGSGGDTGGTVVTGGSGGAGGEEPVVHNQVISETPSSYLEAEVATAASDAQVTSAWIASDENGLPLIGYAFSGDHGASWTEPSEILSPNGGVGADPVVTVDAQGNFYLVWLGYFYGPNEVYDMHLYVARADAGTTTFQLLGEITDPLADGQYDKPWIAVTNKGTLLVTYLEESPSDVTITIARSTDEGQTWSHSALSNAYGNLAFLCVPQQGDRVWLTYAGFAGWSPDIVLNWSDDDGASWPGQNETTVSVEGDVAYTDPNCAAEQDEVWISYGRSSDDIGNDLSPKLHAIQVAHSSDGGGSIDGNTEVFTPEDGLYAMLPQMARDPGGDIHLTYYVGAFNGDPNGTFQRRRATPSGSALLLDPSVLIERPLDFIQDRGHQQWLGDYTGLAVRDGKLYAAFPVNTTGYSHIAFHAADVP